MEWNSVALTGTIAVAPMQAGYIPHDNWYIEIETESRLPAEYNPLTRFIICLPEAFDAEQRARLTEGVKVCVHGVASYPNKVDARAMWILTASKKLDAANPVHDPA